MQNPAMPVWVNLLERFGISTFLVVFGCVALWRLLPHILTWLKQTAETSRVIAQTMPKIAETIDESSKRLERIEQKLDNPPAPVAQRRERPS